MEVELFNELFELFELFNAVFELLGFEVDVVVEFCRRLFKRTFFNCSSILLTVFVVTCCLAPMGPNM